MDGCLEASGSIPLSAHPNPDVRARHLPRTREALRPADWDCSINWDASEIGRYSSVAITRASLEAWLDTGRDAQFTSSIRPAPDSKINDAIRTAYDRAKATQQKPPNVREIVAPVQNALLAEGLNATGRQIQKLADAEEFKKRRRKPGSTIKSEKHR
jgi:hypothetical protein